MVVENFSRGKLAEYPKTGMPGSSCGPIIIIEHSTEVAAASNRGTAATAKCTLRLSIYFVLIHFCFRVYWLGAPGVGTLRATCAPLSCALINAVVKVMPLPET